MMLALALLLSVVVLGQVFLCDIYALVQIENDDKLKDSRFPKIVQSSLRGYGAALVVCLVGILAVKINFLLFFKRLGRQITSYLIMWYAALVFTIACGITVIAMVDYKCMFNSLEYTILHCKNGQDMRRSMVFQLVSVIFDVVSDVFSKFIHHITLLIWPH